MESKTEVLRRTYLSEVSAKYAEKPWSETFQMVHRCMEKARAENKPCELIMRCLEKLQEYQNVSSVSAMVNRLEMMAKQRGLGSHLSPTETACYLTADLFYVEVLLLPGGKIDDVKVAQHGETPQPNESLLQLLRNKKFEEFSLKLDDLVSLYTIPGDNETKIKIYTALQHLQKDLLVTSTMSRHLKENDLHYDQVLNGTLGCITPSREGSPMSIQYYISPTDALMEKSHSGNESCCQAAIIVVGTSAIAHKLQMESLIPNPHQLDSFGLPIFTPLSEARHESLPAVFLLKLNPPLPTLHSFISKMSQISEVPPDAGLQMEPLVQLLQKDALEDKHCNRSNNGKESLFVTTLPDEEFHSYLFDEAKWQCESWKGSLIHTVPFTHPAHVPALLDTIRHQSAINTLLTSCITGIEYKTGLVCDLSCEILPESDSCLSVTFIPPESESLAVLLLSVVNSRQVSCRLLTSGLVDYSLDDYISRVVTRCMSIPITMRAIRKKISSLKSSEPSLPAAETVPKTEKSLSTFHSCAARSSPTTLPSQEPEVKHEPPSNSGHYVMSVAAAPTADVANTDVTAKCSPCASVNVHPQWGGGNLSAELI